MRVFGFIFAALALTVSGEAVLTNASISALSHTADCSNVLITGISGMIGSHVARTLVASQKKCYNIFGLVRPRSDLSALSGIMNQITLLKGDLNDAGVMFEVVKSSQPIYVYHYGTSYQRYII